MKEYDDKYQVPALQKTVTIIQAVANNDNLKMQDILDIVNCSKSHLYAILTTLCACGWLQLCDDKSYRIGETLVKNGTMRLYPLELVRLFYAELTHCNHTLDFTYQMSILEHTEIVYIAKTKRDEDGHIITYPGMRMPAHSTAMGKVMLSQFSRDSLGALYPGYELERVTPNTVSNVDELWVQIAEFKRSGFALEVGETKTGYSCVAAPIYNAFGRMAAAISMATLTPYPSREHEQAGLVVQDLCRQISAKLGYTTQNNTEVASVK